MSMYGSQKGINSNRKGSARSDVTGGETTSTHAARPDKAAVMDTGLQTPSSTHTPTPFLLEVVQGVADMGRPTHVFQLLLT